jgi:hypothetical protein
MYVCVSGWRIYETDLVVLRPKKRDYRNKFIYIIVKYFLVY